MGNPILPASVGAKLQELAAGIRRMRVLRGMSWFALAMLGLLLAALVGDAALDLTPRARTIVFSSWVLAGLAAAWWFIFRRALGPVPHEQLARAVEANYPSLAERLQTLVELDRHADPANGSRAMMAMLARDTERRTARLNFLAAAPRGYSLRLAIASFLALAMAAGPLLFLPGSGDRLRRVMQPWYVPPVEVPFRVVVSSGEPVVKRGESVTLAGYAERLKAGEPFPTQATVIVREKGVEKTYPMLGDDKATFTFTKPSVGGDFEYGIVIGSARSDWFKVSVVDPAQIAAGTRYRVRPPEYAKANVPESTVDGLGEIEALQFSTVRFELKFQHPVLAASLQWKPKGTPANAPAETIAVQLSPERSAATAEFPVRTDGTLRWSLEADRGVRTEIPVFVRAISDTPPLFEKVAGFPAMAKEIRPNEPLVFELALRDDIAVGSAVLEFGRAETLSTAAPFTETLPLPNMGSPRVEGRLSFSLANRFREGERVSFRLKVRDNRSVPSAGLAPQEAVYPPQGWATLRVSNAAASLMEQEIRGQHLALEERIAAIRAVVAEAATDLMALRKEILGRPKLAADQSVRLANNRDHAGESAKALEDLARAIDVVPDLRGLGESAKKIATADLRPAEESLRKAGQETTPIGRDASTADAQKSLDSALLRLDDLLKQNDRTGKLRQDRGKIAQLAEDQDRLAKNPAATVKDQQDLKDRLQKTIAESDRLKNATTDTDRKERQRLAGNLREMAENLRKLDQQSRDLDETDGKKKLAGVAADQKELAERIARLAKRTEAAARLGNSPSLEREPAEKARDLIEQQKTTEALTEQEKAARELDRLAETLEKGAKESSDAKQSAAQIERWQRDLSRRKQEAEKAHPNGMPDELAKSLKAEQEAVQKAIDRLQLPRSEELERLRREASDAAKPEANPAKAADELEKLSRALPTNDQRRKAAAAELEKLRREQDAISREADELQREAMKQDADVLAKKRKDLAARQEELTRKVERLDAPGEEQRREQAATEGRKAGNDLRDSAQDAPASQRETKRQLDRLKDALNGKPTPDRAANELARMQNELSEKLQRKPAPDADELQRLQRDQREIQKQLGQLSAPEVDDAVAKARDAVRQAEAELSKPMTDVDELKKKNKMAQEALDRLAEKLGAPRNPPPSPETPAEPGNVLPTAEDVRQAKDLARQQRDLRDRLSKAATDKPGAESVAERQDLQKKHSELAEGGKKLAENLDAAGHADDETRRAAEAARQAAEMIEQAGQHQGKGKAAEAAAARRQAIDSLKQAADVLGPGGEGSPSGKGSENVANAAKKSREAETAMNEAMKNARDGKPDSTGMAGAADKLKQAAEQLAPGQAGEPAGLPGGEKPGKPDPRGQATTEAPTSALTANLGKPWGDLPGEVKAQITQELKARYGEDYARIIKLYFEQLAERK